jgi:hypothetical protein
VVQNAQEGPKPKHGRMFKNVYEDTEFCIK